MTSAMRAERSALERVLDTFPEIAVAVSGGVDSLTLATLAHRYLPGRTGIFHAVSPAVPAEATRRVRALAAAEGWNLEVVDAQEFADPRYRANPVNRCFYCKSHLYQAIAACTGASIASGTNLDDLGEYRPGLDAAKENGVRHPYVEAGIGKQALRGIARELGLGDIAELPASPCLSSRIETAIVIEPEVLDLVNVIEDMVRRRTGAATVRCRVRSHGVVIELDARALDALGSAQAREIRSRAEEQIRSAGLHYEVDFEGYRNGSAFLHTPAAGGSRA